MGDCWAEPTLDELFDDVVVRLLMASDGVQEGVLRDLLADVGRRKGAGGTVLSCGCARA